MAEAEDVVGMVVQRGSVLGMLDGRRIKATNPMIYTGRAQTHEEQKVRATIRGEGDGE